MTPPHSIPAGIFYFRPGPDQKNLGAGTCDCRSSISRLRPYPVNGRDEIRVYLVLIGMVLAALAILILSTWLGLT